MAKEKQPNQEMIPSLIIGLGGTGYRVLKHIKRKFLASQRYGNQVPPMVRFYSFDTDANVEEDKSEDVLNTHEKFNIVCQTDKVLTNLKQFPHIANWFPAHRIKDTVAHGARQIRALGRLALFTNINVVTDALRNGLRAVTEKKLLQGPGFVRTPDKVPVNVFICCSVCGGTGSGMLTDMAYIIQELIRREALPAPEVQSYIFLPDAIVDVAESELERIKANGAAAMKEMDLFMENMEKFTARYSDDFFISETVGMNKPSSFCYLIEGEGIDSQNTLELVSAEQIFHSLGTELTKDQKSYLANVPTNAFKAIAGGEFIGKKTNYSAFGVSSCVFPVEQVTEILSQQFAADLMDAVLDWANPKTENEENPWLKEAKNFQHTQHLTLDAAGRLKLLDDIIDLKEFKRLTMNKYRELAVTGVGEVVLQDVTKSARTYEDVKKELDKRIEEVSVQQAQALATAVAEGMAHPFMGCRFLIKFLENLELLLTEYRDMLEGENIDFEKRKKMFLSAARQKQLSLEEEATKSWFFRSRDLIYQYAEQWVDSHNKAYEAQMEIDRREAAGDVLIRLLTSLSNNLKKLQSFNVLTESLEKKFRRNSIAGQTVRFGSGDSDWLLQRSVIDSEDLVRLYGDHVGTAHDYEHLFIGRDGVDLAEKWSFFAENPVLFEQQVKEYAQKLLREKMAEVTIEDFLQKKSAATGEDEIRRIGESLAETGKPLWKLDTYLYTEKTVPLNLLGVYDAENTSIQEHVSSILKADNQAVTTRDPHRITLVQSLHGAPLFALSKIEEWEAKYNKYRHTEFLHAVTEEELKLKWEDHPFRPIAIDKREGIRYFTLGDALGFIQAIKVDGKTRYYATFNPDDKVDPDNKTNEYLGINRFEAFDCFIRSQAIRKLKRHIEKRLDSLGSYDRQIKLVGQVREKLAKFLETMPDDERKTLVREEVKALDAVLKDLDSKQKSDRVESGFVAN